MSRTAQRRRPRSVSRSEARAEARRRGRHAVESDEPGDHAGSTPSPGGARAQPRGLLSRLFPSAPPLPGRPDPLAGFTYAGPAALRGPATAAYLLGQRPMIWLAAGVVWTLARRLESPTVFGFLAAVVEFGALIGAGYLGWQRPWLYGLAGGTVGVVLLLALAVGETLATGGGLGPAPLGSVLAFVLYFGLPTAVMGALAGWFGGYWRRRLVEARSLRQRPRRR